MALADVALVTGTGISGLVAPWGGKPVLIPTPFGPFRARLVEQEGVRVLLVQRHSAGHKVPPHRVQYRAMADGLRRSGVKGCLATAAVGSLRTDWVPGTVCVASDLVDLSSRRLTMFDQMVEHCPMDSPFPLAPRLRAAAPEGTCPRAIYANLDGPRYETPTEVRMLGGLGCDIVGMTAGTEAILCKESGVPYGCLAVVTNLGTGLDDEIGHGAVVDQMVKAGQAVLETLTKAAKVVASGV